MGLWGIVKKYWFVGLLLVAGTILLLGLLLSPYVTKHREQLAEAGYAYQPEPSEPQKASCVVSDLTTFLRCAYDYYRAYQPQKRETYDLQAQQDMARWAYSLLILTFIGLITSTFGIFLVFENLRLQRAATTAAVDGLEAQRQQFLAERRPWLAVSVSPPEPPKKFGYKSGGYFYLNLRITAKNVGQLPARNVCVERIVEHDPLKGDDFKQALERTTTWYANSGVMVFPQDGQKIFDESCRIAISDGARWQSIRIIGWVEYRFDGSELLHKTPFVWYVRFTVGADDDLIFEELREASNNFQAT